MKAKKLNLRIKILKLLRTQDERKRLTKSRVILRKLLKSPEFRRAHRVMFYASFDGEVDTQEMMHKANQLHKKIVLPVMHRNRTQILPVACAKDEPLNQGPYGIRQPRYLKSRVVDVDALDLVVVPGVAFDRAKRRLGRGGGYYDRFLKTLPSDTPTIGLAFDFQLVARLPHHPAYDVPVKRVITN